MAQESPTVHPVLSVYVDDVERALVLVGRWISNRVGEWIATREYPIESEAELDEMLASAGSVDGPAPEFLRAFVSYRRALVAAQQRLRATPAGIDGRPYCLIDTREPKGRLLVSVGEWERAPGEAALFLAEWSPDGQCPIETTDLWNSGLPRTQWTDRRFDPGERLPDLVQRSFVRSGDPDHPFRPDLAVVVADPHITSTGARAFLLMRACGDDWDDARYAESPEFEQAVYWLANHGGDVRREPFPRGEGSLEETSDGVRTAVLEALDTGPVSTCA